MISLRTILRGVLVRFLPALVVGTAIFFALASLADRIVVGWLSLAVLYGFMTLGYTSALLALRYRLRTDADVAGRRSVVAGLIAPAAQVSGFVLMTPESQSAFFAASFVVGLVLAVGMFFPWLKGAPMPALTDQESHHVLQEAPVEFPGLDFSREAGRNIQE